MPQQEDEHFLERTAPLLALPSAESAQEGVQQLQGHAEDTQTDGMSHGASDVPRNAAETPQAKQKPGFLAKTIFCTVFAPVLVPVLAVGGCLQLHDALSVQRKMWTYSV